MVDAARDLLAQGATPTVEQAAANASVSRPTAYRYFPNQQALLMAAYPPLAVESLLPDHASDDPFERLHMASKALVRLLLDQEIALRAMLRISLEQTAQRPPLALRTGRRIRWVEDALAPLRSRLEPQRFDDLVIRIAATLGIEPLIWLIDIAHVERTQAARMLCASARDILKGAL
ncbi:MAG: TetR/AcrR family transcriptional regulator [Candidatus Velthaea sp.]